MALRHSFEKQGVFLFKKRGFIPLVLFILAIPAIYTVNNQWINDHRGFSWFLLITSVAITVFGQLIRAWAIGTSAKQTSGRNTWGHEAESLNTTGMYSMLRHPLYFGNYFMWMGIVVFTANLWFIIIVTLLFWLYYERIMYSEEVFLEKQFGDHYLDWAKDTPAFIPAPHLYKKSEVPFSLKTVLRREYPGVASAILGFWYVDMVRDWCMAGKPVFHWKYVITVLVALTYAFLFKILKHHTAILKESDRS